MLFHRCNGARESSKTEDSHKTPKKTVEPLVYGTAVTIGSDDSTQ